MKKNRVVYEFDKGEATAAALASILTAMIKAGTDEDLAATQIKAYSYMNGDLRRLEFHTSR